MLLKSLVLIFVIYKNLNKVKYLSDDINLIEMQFYVNMGRYQNKRTINKCLSYRLFLKNYTKS